MKDYKHIGNKLDRQREIDFTQYQWHDGGALKGAVVGAAFMLVAVVITICLLGWATEANADTPRLYSQDGRFLGNLSNNRFDPNSVSNPYGRYGNRYSPDSINNPYGRYGNRYSPESVNNPYATNPVRIYVNDPWR